MVLFNGRPHFFEAFGQIAELEVLFYAPPDTDVSPHAGSGIEQLFSGKGVSR